jgi:uncharacterized cupredoxin-like copper-binding protein
MRRTWFIPALLAALLGSLALARAVTAQQPTEVAVTLTEYKVTMQTTSSPAGIPVSLDRQNVGSISIPAGVPVTFSATNQGSMMHEMVLEKAGAVDQPIELNGQTTEIGDIAPGETKSATWTITQPGEYQLACHLPGHFEHGMVERFTVVAQAGGSAPDAQPMQIAAVSAGNPAGHESSAMSGDMMDMPAAAPATLPDTGNPISPLALPWLAAAGGVLAAIGLLVLTLRLGRRQG